MKIRNLFIIIFLLILSVQLFAQMDEAKFVYDFNDDILQIEIVANQLIFSEKVDFSLSDEKLWSYDLNTKEINLISSSLEHYSSHFYVHDSLLFFNKNGKLVLYNTLNSDLDTVYETSFPIYTSHLWNAESIGDVIYFIADIGEDDLWSINISNKNVNCINLQEQNIRPIRILSATDNFIYFLGQNSSTSSYIIGVYDKTNDESKIIYTQPSIFYDDIPLYTSLADDLFFLNSTGSNSTVDFKRYDAVNDSIIDLTNEVNIASNNTQIYYFHKIDENRFVFMDKNSFDFWTYEAQSNQINRPIMEYPQGYPVNCLAIYTSTESSVYFKASYSDNPLDPLVNGILEYNLAADTILPVIHLENSDYFLSDSDFHLLGDSALITEIYCNNVSPSYSDDYRMYTNVSLIDNSFDSIFNSTYSSRNGILGNSLYYSYQPDYYTADRLYKYDLNLNESTLVQGDYFTDVPYYYSIRNVIPVGDSILFFFDNSRQLWTIDDSYYDSLVVKEACDYYIFLNDTLTESGQYRKRKEGNFQQLDTVINLNLTINTINKSVSNIVYSYPSNVSYYEVAENDADSYQWIDCIYKNPIIDETNRKYYYSDDIEYAVAMTKGSCIDTSFCSDYSIINECTCDSFVAPDGQIYYESGTYYAIIPDSNGNDSNIVIELLVKYTSLTINTCNSYTALDGNIYETSGTYTIINLDSTSCDSIITLDLTINESSTSIISEIVCDSYTVPSGNNTYFISGNYTDTISNTFACDSIITIDLTVNNTNTGTDSIVACDSYQWIDNNTYHSSNNTATYILTNSAGCDSIVSLDLTINSVDTSTTINSYTITSNASDATYQWLNCSNNYSIIAGENSQSFTATNNGTYAVEVTQNECIDTSSCTILSYTGIIEHSQLKNIQLYPNPTKGQVTIDFGELSNPSIKVLNIEGKLILQKVNINEDLFSFQLDKASGIYFVEVSYKGETKVFKLDKE